MARVPWWRQERRVRPLRRVTRTNTRHKARRRVPGGSPGARLRSCGARPGPLADRLARERVPAVPGWCRVGQLRAQERGTSILPNTAADRCLAVQLAAAFLVQPAALALVINLSAESQPGWRFQAPCGWGRDAPANPSPASASEPQRTRIRPVGETGTVSRCPRRLTVPTASANPR